jgi:hypothetical protein
MDINWQEIITTVGVTTGVGIPLMGAAAWVIKTTITSRLARDAEAFKTALKADANMEIERLKNSLQMAAVEHQYGFLSCTRHEPKL